LQKKYILLKLPFCFHCFLFFCLFANILVTFTTLLYIAGKYNALAQFKLISIFTFAFRLYKNASFCNITYQHNKKFGTYRLYRLSRAIFTYPKSIELITCLKITTIFNFGCFNYTIWFNYTTLTTISSGISTDSLPFLAVVFFVWVRQCFVNFSIMALLFLSTAILSKSEDTRAVQPVWWLKKDKRNKSEGYSRQETEVQQLSSACSSFACNC